MVKYLGKRFLLMLLSVWLISIVSFVVIELPPGDFLTLYINQLQLRGEKVDQARIESLRAQYGYGESFPIRYAKWIGGIVLRGEFGRSFFWNKPVKTLLADVLPATIMISLCTIIFTYVVAIPIGIYSATHQYSIGDYLATIFGFIGLATPSFKSDRHVVP